MIEAVGYVRLSKDEDKEKYASIIHQKKLIGEWASNHDCIITDWYEDDNFSGYIFDRPDFTRLINDLETGKVSTLIVKDLSRIGRHNAHTLLFIEQIRNLNKRLILINEGNGGWDSTIDNDDLVGIKTWYNEMYVKDISKKIRSAMTTRQKEGTMLIREYYGYKKHPTLKNTLIIEEELVPILKEMFELYMNGFGYRKIADLFTKKGYPTPSVHAKKRYEENGKVYKRDVNEMWYPSVISRLLKDNIYIGTLTLGKWKRQNLKGKTKQVFDEELQYIFMNNHTPIIDEKTFNLVQEIGGKRNAIHYRGKEKHDNIFSGFLLCNDCQKSMVAINNTRDKRHYVCGNYHIMGTKSNCTRHTIQEEKLVLYLKKYLNYIKQHLNDFIISLDKDVESKLSTKENYGTLIKKLKKDLNNEKEELKMLINQKIKALIKENDNETKKIIEDSYEEMETERKNNIKIFTDQITEFTKVQETSENISTYAVTAIEIFDNIINKEIPSRKDLELILNNIEVMEDGNPKFNLRANLTEVVESLMTNPSLSECNSMALITQCLFSFVKNYDKMVA
jgi:site-specific DNA recombinase